MIIHEVSYTRLKSFEELCDFAEAYIAEHPKVSRKKAVQNAVEDIRYAVKLERMRHQRSPVNNGGIL